MIEMELSRKRFLEFHRKIRDQLKNSWSVNQKYLLKEFLTWKCVRAETRDSLIKLIANNVKLTLSSSILSSLSFSLIYSINIFQVSNRET